MSAWRFAAGLAAGWVGAMVLAFLLNADFYATFWTIVAISFIYFFWLAGARWPSASTVARFGFAAGLAVFNYVAVLAGAVLVGTLIYGA